MKVLLGIGGTDDSLVALERTVDRAATAGDDLTVGVVEDPAADRSRDEVVARAREAVAEAGIDADVRRLDGDPGSALVELAEAEGFEKIVIGGGETSPMGKIKIGSVAEFVLLNSHVTVSLVRE
jgi:nucleotide-binding universal stress UspA family protein